MQVNLKTIKFTKITHIFFFILFNNRYTGICAVRVVLLHKLVTNECKNCCKIGHNLYNTCLEAPEEDLVFEISIDGSKSLEKKTNMLQIN